MFVVDRKDLDYQTIEEFNSFRKDSVMILEKMAKFINGDPIEGVVDRTRAY